MDHDRLMEVSRFATARAATYSTVFTILLALSVLGTGAIIAARPYENCPTDLLAASPVPRMRATT